MQLPEDDFAMASPTNPDDLAS